jgi:hypothetical protein
MSGKEMERLAQTPAQPNASENEEYSARFYPAPSPEAIGRARKNSKASGPGRPPSPARMLAVDLWAQGKPMITIRHQACKLVPGYSELSPPEQEEVWIRLQAAMRKYIKRKNISRTKQVGLEKT